ncbi:UNKNOWN [Stylonychia lemnae]|uniref:Uncharacterized protein n=1 Tax=Stylonychia lemnae TaxID=5949 RepID=A0A077ZQJ4_STYLE|nr:UNKNOWN [Stylonychia lemnae]|eukprot:CDW72177.1 UNKNOWN [Stylonychia lemnae]
MLDIRIIAKKNLLKKTESETELLAQSGLLSIHYQGLSRIKNNPQQIVAIEVTNESVSNSFKAFVLNGWYLELNIKNEIRTRNIIRAYAIIPKLLMKTEIKIITIFLYIITISQQKNSILQPRYKNPYISLIQQFSRFYLSLNNIANAKKGIPIPHIKMLDQMQIWHLQKIYLEKICYKKTKMKSKQMSKRMEVGLQQSAYGTTLYPIRNGYHNHHFNPESSRYQKPELKLQLLNLYAQKIIEFAQTIKNQMKKSQVIVKND